MDEPKNILTVYIGQKDIFEWSMNDGKSVLMPELLIGCEELLYNELDEVKCLRVESFVRKEHTAYDFFVYRSACEETLDKILEWALDEEEYELCQRVHALKTYIENDNEF
jgi:hypothetical protein